MLMANQSILVPKNANYLGSVKIIFVRYKKFELIYLNAHIIKAVNVYHHGLRLLH